MTPLTSTCATFKVIGYMFVLMFAMVVCSHDMVLSRYPHGVAGRQHGDTIRCHSASTAHHSSFEALIEDFVLADTIWCVDPKPGSSCSDRTSQTMYKLISISCQDEDRECTATIDCYDLVLERFWVCLVLTLLAVVTLVVSVRYAYQTAERNREKQRQKMN